MEKLKIGLIGLGNIGTFYAKKLLEANYTLYVYNRTKSKLEEPAALGALIAASPEELTDSVDVIILSLIGSHVVEPIMRDKIVPHLREGQVVIDTSTCHPRTEELCEALCKEKKAGFLEAPLTWRASGQILMIGGEEQVIQKVEDILRCISYRYQRVGGIGSGQRLKALNQAYIANNLMNYAELIEYAQKAELDPYLIRDLLEFPVPENLLREDYAGQRNLAMHYKDLGYFMEIAHEIRAFVPMTGFAHEIFKSCELSCDPTWAQAGIRTFYQKAGAGRDDKITKPKSP